MIRGHRFDAEDPFGTRPDEKPPAGWDAGFWEGVRDRIEQRRREPGPPSGPPVVPEPPHRSGPARMLALSLALLTLMMLAAAAGIFGPPPLGGAIGRTGRTDRDPTFVRVSGSEDPPVAVEWTRTGGCRSGYVMFQSLEPEVSYVVIRGR